MTDGKAVWFERYVAATSAAASRDPGAQIGGPLPCPCCGFPTLSERAAWEICRICWWEDDGQDDSSADQVWGGPSGKYSLSDARRNFADHQHMYDAGQGIDVVTSPSAARLSLLTYVASLGAGGATLDMAGLKTLLAKAATPMTASLLPKYSNPTSDADHPRIPRGSPMRFFHV
ncbi:CPCC family cysteine-rich protein [Jannaschia pohangensis]|uniref:Cysteine-rich CPCC n=1 Tax=Jannaschia pohangensis TaxID=390807 RepID=A0A1I3Q948_9RHOB|nr:CPCC family cysteine-rich protein [Jannaschia pohangensis]SFJ30082.1 Cysteine-rich CPCC [Jannaschia pohangensis]